MTPHCSACGADLTEMAYGSAVLTVHEFHPGTRRHFALCPTHGVELRQALGRICERARDEQYPQPRPTSDDVAWDRL